MKSELQVVFDNLPQGGSFGRHRSCIEKEMAIVLVLGGIKTLRPGVSYYIGNDNELNGLLVNPNSIITEPYIYYKNGNFFWKVLEKCGIKYCGSTNNDNPKKSYAQASWLPESQEKYTIAVDIRPLLICTYFDVIKRLDDEKLLIRN